ncbi:Asp-tRNA(Asn)/Glu-tRNA(Gln) amidotransferase subunit GatB [Candidatus Methanoliparum sp. LAM-1]|nr:Asp-tRNA(Asn)/Glu-tRNA(Gln) amidotransferase subunit GatB [Candidatus Methanoliparum sp. LAM-1]BDC35373.1 aspartyl/glutamyl-tRNA amidotransferase subunit B [Candidatus Methanoliparum sp. LAM-1]
MHNDEKPRVFQSYPEIEDLPMHENPQPNEINPDSDVIIGLEIHVQLNKLKSKLFCGCSTSYHNSEPNTHTCPVCLGLPGSLPALNKKAVEFGIKVALALECKLLDQTLFYRKNYFYPDLPKGYQISQYDFPLAKDGRVTITTDAGEKVIRINRVHIEEDPAKLMHIGGMGHSKYTLVDYNRSGMPLLEIVTEPDLRSPKEARRFLDKLRSILDYLDVFDGNLEGAMRIDANISLKGGGRTEVKNISSHKGVEKALLYEKTRHKNLRMKNIHIKRETRHYDEQRGITILLRTKEEEEDYRYFPEPDIPLMNVKEWETRLRNEIPELPDAKRQRFIKEYGIKEEHARSLTSDIAIANYFEIISKEIDPSVAASWIADVVKGELNYRDINIKESNLTADKMIRILKKFVLGEITDRNMVELIREIIDSGKDPEEIIKKRGFGKVGEDEVLLLVKKVIEENPDAVKDYRNKNDKALNYLVGKVMALSKGRSDPKEVINLLRKYI